MLESVAMNSGLFYSDIFKAWAIILAVIFALKLIAHRLNEWEDWVKMIEILFLAECSILTFLAVLKWSWIAVFAH